MIILKNFLYVCKAYISKLIVVLGFFSRKSDVGHVLAKVLLLHVAIDFALHNPAGFVCAVCVDSGGILLGP